MNKQELSVSFNKFLAENKDAPPASRDFLDAVLFSLNEAKSVDDYTIEPFDLALAFDAGFWKMCCIQRMRDLSSLGDNYTFLIQHFADLAGELGCQTLDYLHSGEYRKIWDKYNNFRYPNFVH